MRSYERVCAQNKQLLEELKKLKTGRVLTVQSEEALHRLVKDEKYVGDFGELEYGTVADLYREIRAGLATLERDGRTGEVVRVIEVVYLRLTYPRDNLVLVESHRQASDGI